MEEKTIIKEMENLDSNFNNYVKDIEKIESKLDEFFNKMSKVYLLDAKAFSPDVSMEDFSKLARENLSKVTGDQLIGLDSDLAVRVMGVNKLLSKISELKISDIYILTSKLNFERYELFRKLKKEYPNLSAEFISQRIGYIGAKKIDKDVIDRIKVLKEKAKNIKEIIRKKKFLVNLIWSMIPQKRIEEILSVPPISKNEEFFCIYKRIWDDGSIDLEFKGITTKQEFDFLCKTHLEFQKVKKFYYEEDYILKKPETLEELNLVAKSLKELQELDSQPSVDEIGKLYFNNAYKITKRELLTRGLWYIYTNKWSPIRKIKTKDSIENNVDIDLSNELVSPEEENKKIK